MGEPAMRRLMAGSSFILTLDEVRSSLAEAGKVPDADPIHKDHAADEHAAGLRSRGEAEEKKEREIGRASSLPVPAETGPPWASSSRPQSAAQTPSGARSPASSAPAGPASAPQSAHLSEPERKSIEVTVARPPSYRPLAKEYAPRIQIQNHTDVSGQSRCVGSVEDFVAYFRDRFEREGAILKTHQTNLPVLRTGQLSQHSGEEVRIIAMVTEKRMTHNGNLYIELEDEEGAAKAIFSPRERGFAQKAGAIIRDDVVALDVRVGPNFLSVKDVTWPDIPLLRPQKTAEADLAVAYLSDTHIGSKLFLEKSFRRFIRWLWGEEGREELAGRVKYVIIAGDICDGIGVYPAQEKELSIKDIYEQYAAFDKLMEAMPDWVEVIISPGNHDAVRRGEPQPIIPMEMVKSDVKKIGSPAMVDLEGFRHLVYHGTSLDSVIANVPGLSYVRPEGAMMEVLRRRHLSPVYGENPIVPERRDYMVIEEEPDVVHMGHLHKNAAMKYRGTLLLNSGTFQERTDFQVRMGHVPTPGIVPILELKDQRLSQLKFTEETI